MSDSTRFNDFDPDEQLDQHIHFLPTPQAIKDACLALQATWSETEFRRRAAGIVGGLMTDGDQSLAAPRWTPPVVRGLRGAA